jgi:DNA polymerase elongation subunit (family B)
MLEEIKLSQLLFLDVETVPSYPEYKQQPEILRTLWDKKAQQLARNGETSDELYNRAGIYAEFGKIVCISLGFFFTVKGKRQFKIKSFYGEDEHQLLSEFAKILNISSNVNKLLCAHNGKEFDFPFIARRMLVNKIKLPKLLNIAGKKPWEVKHLDTLELWKFGDYKHYTSLNLLAAIFDIPSPKDDIDGSMIHAVYWKEKDLDRIKKYCEKDVVTIAQLMLSYKGEPLLNEENIVIAE